MLSCIPNASRPGRGSHVFCAFCVLSVISRCVLSLSIKKKEKDAAKKQNQTFAIEVGPMCASPPRHRPKSCPLGLWFQMQDPLVGCPEPVKAIDVKRMVLDKMGTFVKAQLFEAENAARLHPDAHLARLFAIMGIKHYEQSREHHN